MNQFLYKIVFILEIINLSLTNQTLKKFKSQVTFASALSDVGGTMGLLTGFSILSAVEIIFYLIKLFVRFVKERKKAVDRIIENSEK